VRLASVLSSVSKTCSLAEIGSLLHTTVREATSGVSTLVHPGVRFVQPCDLAKAQTRAQAHRKTSLAHDTDAETGLQDTQLQAAGSDDELDNTGIHVEPARTTFPNKRRRRSSSAWPTPEKARRIHSDHSSPRTSPSLLALSYPIASSPPLFQFDLPPRQSAIGTEISGFMEKATRLDRELSALQDELNKATAQIDDARAALQTAKGELDKIQQQIRTEHAMFVKLSAADQPSERALIKGCVSQLRSHLEDAYATATKIAENGLGGFFGKDPARTERFQEEEQKVKQKIGRWEELDTALREAEAKVEQRRQALNNAKRSHREQQKMWNRLLEKYQPVVIDEEDE